MNKAFPKTRTVIATVIATLSFLPLVASAAGTSGLSGKYLGEFFFQVNGSAAPGSNGPPAGKQVPYDGVEFDPANPATFYLRPGFSVKPMWWEWEFDGEGGGKVRFGSGSVLALGVATPPIQFRKQGYQRVDGQTRPLLQPPEDEITATFTDNGDGTYTLNYNLQIYLGEAGLPAGDITNKFQIARNEDGTISVLPLDEDVNGVKDGIPGVSVNGVFPFTVSPQVSGPVLYKESGKDSNGDGITDLQAALLGLDPYKDDFDGDGAPDAQEIGKYWFLPLDSNYNGIPDVLEPGALATDAIVVDPFGYDNFRLGEQRAFFTEAHNVRLLNGERVHIRPADGNWFYGPTIAARLPVDDQSFWDGGLNATFGPLPTNLNYDLGALFLNVGVYASPRSVPFLYRGVVQGIKSSTDTANQNRAQYQSSGNEYFLHAAESAEAILAVQQADRQKIVDAYGARLEEVFGAGYESLTPVQLLTKINQYPKVQSGFFTGQSQLHTGVVLDIEFEDGVPEGVQFFWSRQSNEGVSGQDKPLEWRDVGDGKTVEVALLTDAAVTFSYSYQDGVVTRDSNQSRAFTLLIGYGGEKRAPVNYLAQVLADEQGNPDNGNPDNGNPVTPPVQNGGGHHHGGGALGGELAGLLGLALLPLRRRIGARLNRWATRLGA